MAIDSKRISRPWLVWAFCFVLLGAPVNARDWIKLESDDFILMSDAREIEVRRFAFKYAAYRQAIFSVVKLPLARSRKSVVILHDRRKDLQKYTDIRQFDRNTTTVNVSARVDGRGVMAMGEWERGTHGMGFLFVFESNLYFEEQGWTVPSWLILGMERVFSTAQVLPVASAVEVGRKPETMPRLSVPWAMSWEQFFSVESLPPERLREFDWINHTRQSWALMHWVILRDEHSAERLQELIGRLGSGDPLEAFESVLNIPVGSWDTEIRHHLSSQNSRQVIEVDRTYIEQNLHVSPLPEFEKLVYQSEIAGSTDDEQSAERFLMMAREQAPDELIVLEATARWLLRRDDRPAAVQAYRRAIDLGTQNPYAYLVSAGDRLVGSAQHVSSEFDLAISEVKMALELDPYFEAAYTMLGEIANLEPEPNPAWLPVFSRRIGAGSEGAQVRYYRGLLLHRLGRIDDAVADMTQLTSHPSASEDTKNRALVSLHRWSFASTREEVESLMEAQKFIEAREALTAWMRSNPETELEAEINQLHRQLDKASYEVERVALQAMLESRDFEGAWERVERLRAGADSENLRQAFGRMEQQVSGLALSSRVSAAQEASDWVAVVENADQFLSTQPTDHRSRAKIEKAREHALASLDAPSP